MSKYTTEIRFICESKIGFSSSLGYNSVNDIVKQAAPIIFNFDFPIFDETYRTPLEIKILKHFYTREIGFETFGLFQLNLDTLLNELMPYYNELYKSALYEFNPLYNVDIITEHVLEYKGKQNSDSSTTENLKNTETNGGKITNTTNGNSNQKRNENGVNTLGTNSTDLYSDTPQGSITNLESNRYLTNARKITNGGSNENDVNITDDITTNNQNVENRDTISTSVGNNSSQTIGLNSIDNLEKYIEHVKGKQGDSSFASLINEFRSTLINVDKLLIDELEPLFFTLW